MTFKCLHYADPAGSPWIKRIPTSWLSAICDERGTLLALVIKPGNNFRKQWLFEMLSRKLLDQPLLTPGVLLN